MTLIENLKNEEPFDKYIVFLLALGFSVREVAKLTNIQRQTVYKAIKRNSELLDKHGLTR